MSGMNLVVHVVVLTLTGLLLQISADCPKPKKDRNVLSKITPTQNDLILSESTVVEFKCKSGFEHSSGDRRIVCTNGQWQVLHSEKSRQYLIYRCTEKPCPVHEIPNGKMEVEKNRFVTYTCERGYRLNGFNQSQCRLNERGIFFLTTPRPSCVPLEECELPTDSHLQVSENCCFAGDEVLFTCDDDYRLEGNKSAVCLPTGNWDQPSPSCARIKRCTDPGETWRGTRSGDCCEVGSVLKYECYDGHELVQKEDGNSITCLSDEEWSGSVPQCKPIGEMTCPNIPMEENNLIFESEFETGKNVFLVDDEVDLGCRAGYDTDAYEKYLVCQDDGMWDAPIPVCKEKSPCSRPLAPSNGHIIELDDNPDQTEFPILYEILMECDFGYTSANGHYGSRCLGNDEWENHLNCTKITCNDPGFPKFGYRSGTDFSYNSNVTFECNGSYKLRGSMVRTCKENGRWSGTTAICDGTGFDCHDPGTPVNSYRKGNNFNIGDIVAYTCVKGSVQIAGNTTRECLGKEDGADWSGTEIECLSQNEFSDKEEATEAISETMGSAARSVLTSPPAVFFGRSAASNDGVPGTDVIFAFDRSGSITTAEYEQAKDFAETLIRKIGVSHSHGGIRWAVISFSKASDEHVSLQDKSVNDIISKIRRMKKGTKEGTNIKVGLNLVMQIAQRSIEYFPGRKKIAFVVTDGAYNTGGPPVAEAITLRDSQHGYNVEVYAVGIGKGKKLDVLHSIAGDQKHLLLFESHMKLVDTATKAIRDVDYAACGLERPLLFNDTTTIGNRIKGGGLIRISGGAFAKRPWPWMAALLLNEAGEFKVKCGGSIIHPYWILSAAHCFWYKDRHSHIQDYRNNELWLVTVGATDLESSNGWDMKVAKFVLHPEYNLNTLDFDIALVRLKDTLKYDLYIRPICLPPAVDDMPDDVVLYTANSVATVVGYGHTIAKAHDSDVADAAVKQLKELEIRLKAEEICNRTVTFNGLRTSSQWSPQMICAASDVVGHDACQGDSGGPLMQLSNSVSANNTQERWFLVGVVSWGIGCGQKGYNAYYSYVSKLRPWINDITEKHNDTEVIFEDALPKPKPQIVG